MIRHTLSKIFAAVAYQWDSVKRHRSISQDFYRDEIVKDLETLLHKHTPTWTVSLAQTGTGKGVLTIGNSRDNEDIQFTMDVEWSDFLLATGREASIKMEGPYGKGALYYGDSWNPDNDARTYKRLNNQWDVEKIADFVKDQYYEHKTQVYNAKQAQQQKPALS